jgi:Raf kinase inhibitor-like YbhB/YbcL family protein
MVMDQQGGKNGRGFSVRSPMFEDGEVIPVEFTCDGDNLSPALTWEDAPQGTRSFALIVHDPDAPAGDWVHWLIYDIPGNRDDLPSGVRERDIVAGVGIQGRNDFRRTGWGGPCPPQGPPHRYLFHLMALDTTLDLDPGIDREALLAAVRGHVLGEAELMGRYQRGTA